MSKYAKNYLPILFNIYTTELALEKDPIRQSLFDTIKVYLQVTDLELINTYLMQCVKNFENFSKLYEASLTSMETVDSNNNDSQENAQKKKVVFDFDKKSKATQPATGHNLHLYAKNGFLDLIALLAKYSNQNNVPIIYALAITGIEVN